MLTKQDHINYWKKTAEDSWNTGEYLLKGEKFVDALFMFNLSIEKLLKAKWVKDNIDNYPPRSHDLQYLYANTNLEFDADMLDFMDTVGKWNIEGRYPDFKFTLHRIANITYTEKQYEKLKKLKACLLKEI